MFNFLRKKIIAKGQFKKRIENGFSTWEIDRFHARKGDFDLWIGNAFEDRGGEFLENFKEWEKELLWKEVMREKAKRMAATREEALSALATDTK